MSLLNMTDVSIRFGGLLAVHHVNLCVEPGNIHALIGPNGAGKSTVFNLITGIYKPSEGKILYQGKSIGGKKPYHIAAAGIARTFQNIHLFNDLTVMDNVLVGAHTSGRASMIEAVLRFAPWVRSEERKLRYLAMESLEAMELKAKSEELARNLPYGEQRRLEIARALAVQPKLLLLDEPAAGMNPQEKQVLMTMVKSIHQRGITVLLVEHDMKFIMNISNRIAVLDYGEKIAEGLPEEIRSNPQVIEAYLGKGAV